MATLNQKINVGTQWTAEMKLLARYSSSVCIFNPFELLSSKQNTDICGVSCFYLIDHPLTGA